VTTIKGWSKFSDYQKIIHTKMVASWSNLTQKEKRRLVSLKPQTQNPAPLKGFHTNMVQLADSLSEREETPGQPQTPNPAPSTPNPKSATCALDPNPKPELCTLDPKP
jgi:hypothetical protein